MSPMRMNESLLSLKKSFASPAWKSSDRTFEGAVKRLAELLCNKNIDAAMTLVSGNHESPSLVPGQRHHVRHSLRPLSCPAISGSMAAHIWRRSPLRRKRTIVEVRRAGDFSPVPLYYYADLIFHQPFSSRNTQIVGIRLKCPAIPAMVLGIVQGSDIAQQ